MSTLLAEQPRPTRGWRAVRCEPWQHKPRLRAGMLHGSVSGIFHDKCRQRLETQIFFPALRQN